MPENSDSPKKSGSGKGLRPDKSRRLTLLLRVVVAIAAVVWVFRGQDWHLLGEHLANLNLGYLALSVGVYIVAQVLVAVRWWLLLRAQSIYIPVWMAVKLFFLGLFYGNVMPSSMGGDVLRAWYVTKHTPKRLEAVLSVFVDRVLGLLGTLTIAFCSYLFFFRGRRWTITPAKPAGGAGHASQYIPAIVGTFVVVVVLLVVLLAHRKGRMVFWNAWLYVRAHGVEAFRKAKDAIVIYCCKPLTMILAFALTIFLQSIVIAAFWLVGRDLGVTAEAKYYFFFFPLTWGVAALPVSIAGIGLLEGGMRELFTRFAGASVEKAVALALCQRFAWVVGSLPGAVVHILGTHLPKEFFVDYDKGVS